MMIEHSQDWFWEFDENANFTYVSPRIKDLLGYEPEELIGQMAHEKLHSHHGNAFIHRRDCLFFKRVSEGQFYDGEEHFLHKSRKILIVEVASRPIHMKGELVGSVTAFHDITERKRTEEALRKSEASLAHAQRISHLGNWDWNIEKNELHWSDEIYRIFGLKPQEFDATYDAFLNTVHPDDREFVQQSVDAALTLRKPYSIDHRIIRPDGNELIVHEQAEV